LTTCRALKPVRVAGVRSALHSAQKEGKAVDDGVGLGGLPQRLAGVALLESAWLGRARELSKSGVIDRFPLPAAGATNHLVWVSGTSLSGICPVRLKCSRKVDRLNT